MQDKPIEIFFSYSHQDEELRDELKKHLSILKREGVISSWHDRHILAGGEWAGEIDEHLNTAQIILLLISADFLASDYCYGIEMERALERHESGEAQVIPIILRPVDWQGAPFAKLQALPKNAKPLTSWANQDEAFTDVARGIRRTIKLLKEQTALDEQLIEHVAPQENGEKQEDETISESQAQTEEQDVSEASSPRESTRNRFTTLLKENGAIIGVIVGIITILGVLLQFVDSPAIQALFATPTYTNTAIETPTVTPIPPTTTNTPSPRPTDTPAPTTTFTVTPTPFLTASQTPTDLLTPTLTSTPAVTLPAIVEADCVPKGTLRQKAYVLEVIDGDTLKVRIEGDIYLVQYIGITAPEEDAYFGVYAVNKNVELVAGQWVTLVNDQNSQDLEGYLPRYVFVDETFVNYEMLRQGFAFAGSLPPAGACAVFFNHAQNQAQLSPIGMWKPTVTPWPSPVPGEPPCTCWGDTRNCDSFRTQNEAQACFEYCQGLGYGDVHNLDDGDNWACESLP